MNKHVTTAGNCPYLLLLLLILPMQLFHVASLPVSDETAALLSVKSGLLDPLGHLDGWHASSPPCNWTGVGCNSEGHVETLDLSHMNLTGHVTDGLFRLPFLVSLNLCCNQLSSPLPAPFRGLPRLRHLDVSSNLFSGGFPPGLGAASPGLLAVNASGNEFVGRLPEDLASASSLESLDLRGSYFVGLIPAVYANLSNLRFLGISGNSLAGRLPPELGRLASLETLIVGYNGFEGPIPTELGNLTSLSYLDMAVGNLSGSIPPGLGRLQRLTNVYLYRLKLEGEVPAELGNLTSLQYLDLSDNRLTGRIPGELGNLSSLRLLNLMGNRLVGAVPSSLADLEQLEVLALWNNSLDGKLPANLGRSSPLQWLDVSSNSITGEIPAGLCDGGNLTKLILFGNGFTGPIPASLTACRTLVRVRLHENRLNGSIPGGFGRLPRLERLEVAGNELVGAIPEDLAASTTLSFLDFSRNNIESSLPPDILAIPTLQNFVATGNSLTGGIPDQLQGCPFLAVLDISGNRLSGGIPAGLASCRRLVQLNLSRNGLTGEIPGFLATMASLATLDLSNNALSGQLPPDLGSMPALESVNLANNSLTGEVPTNGVLGSISPNELSGNSGLCGAVLRPCPGEPGGSSPRALHVLTAWAVGISAVTGAALLALLARWAHRNWHVLGLSSERGADGEWPWRLTAFQRVGFTGAEVAACVKEGNLIGMGATGAVYRAEVGRERVAVKRLWGPSAGVAGEVGVVGRLRHRNVVRLVATVENERETMLVYEYMAGGNLWEALHGKGGRKEEVVVADWVSRYNVAVGVAQGLAYLHHDCRPPVIHRDVKSSNILLDGNMEARIADFGLARVVSGRNETLSDVAGSHGYIAPEYGYTLKVDEKSDIYSFGVVLMELLTGRKPIEPEFADCQGIVGWVREKIRHNSPVEDLLDPAVTGQCQHVQEEMMLVLRIAVLCTAKFPKDRPSMRDVLTMLGEAKPRRKSSSANGATAAAAGSTSREKPVFSPAPGPDYP